MKSTTLERLRMSDITMECTKLKYLKRSFLELESSGGNESDACLAVTESLACYSWIDEVRTIVPSTGWSVRVGVERLLS